MREQDKIENGKNSFLLYDDLWDHLTEIDVEQRGWLFTAIFALRGVTDMPSNLSGEVKMLVINIRKQFARDNKKWERTRKQKKISGLKGAMKRWHIDGNGVIIPNADDDDFDSQYSAARRLIESKAGKKIDDDDV